MGFFSELKEDLSQAVNELVPEEGPAVGEVDELLPEEESIPVAGAEENPEPEMDGDLSLMLDNLDLELEDEASEILADEPEEAMETTKTEEMTQEWEEEAEVEETQYMGLGTEDTEMTGDVAEETAVITAGMKIRGDISSQGSLDIIGTVEGNIDILGKLNISGTIDGASKAADVYAEKARINGDVHSSASIKIGQNTIIIGNIFANSAVIAGAVKGDIDVKGPVVLDTSAIVMGNIKSKSVQINNGAVIEGLCSQCYADVNPSSFFEDIKKARK